MSFIQILKEGSVIFHSYLGRILFKKKEKEYSVKKVRHGLIYYIEVVIYTNLGGGVPLS